MPASKAMYPNGYPREKNTRFCGDKGEINGATCMIDNPHIGRPHWGPDETGRFHQWGVAGAAKRPFGILSDMAGRRTQSERR